MILSPSKQARIQLLSPLLIDKIAAGEVIEAPFSIIKELVENSLDAGASSIRIDTQAGGTEEITVEDDGHGIHPQDMKTSLVRHATSKIASLKDLENIHCLGFRGEALSAIASISHLQIKSRYSGEDKGSYILCRGSTVLEEGSAEHNKGTTVKVSGLFYSTPARRKYLKSLRTENTRNYKEIMRLALAHPEVHFSYYREGKEFASYPIGQNFYERILNVYGDHLGKHLLEVKATYEGSSLFAYISTPEYFRANREGQFTFVNKRAVDIKNLSFMVRKAYDELLSPGMQPYCFLCLELDPKRIDINVHPQKREIRILDESLLRKLVLHNLSRTLRGGGAIPLEQLEHKKGTLSSTHRPRSYGLPKAPLDPILLHGGLQYSTAHVLNFDHSEKGKSPSTSEGSPPSLLKGNEQRQASPSEIEETVIPNKLRLERHFGTILGTYILAEGDESLYIIDQHTAHERVNYEKNLAKMEKLEGQRQGLLEPVLVHCLRDELEEILTHKGKLLQSGFLLEEMGPKSYAIREIPPYLDTGSEMEIFVRLIHRAIAGVDNLHLYQDYAAMRACRGSIKKNDFLSKELLSDILKDLPQCEEPARCPHGRPTMIQISRQQLDRMFQR